MLCNLADLKDKDLDAIKELEGKVGKPLLAYSCYDVQPAVISDEDLAEIESLEAKLGLSLVAVEG
jgi:hypothetical protein